MSEFTTKAVIEMEFKTKGAQKNMYGALEKFGTISTKSTEKVRNGLDKVTRSTYKLDKETGKAMKHMSTSFEKSRTKLAMWNFGFLFAGMAIKRSMESIMRSTWTTFTKIDQGQSMASLSLTALSANFEYLKFTVGQALGNALIPLLPTLQKLINYFAGIITKNPTMTFGTIIGIWAGATAMEAVGQIGLFMNGLKQMREWKPSQGLLSAIGKDGLFQGLFNWASKLTSGDVGKFLTKGVSLTATFYMTEETFKSFSEGNVLSGMANALGTASTAAVFMGKNKLGRDLMFVSVGLNIIDGVFSDDATTMKNDIANALITAGIFLATTGAFVIGGALGAIGIVLRVIDVEDGTNGRASSKAAAIASAGNRKIKSYPSTPTKKAYGGLIPQTGMYMMHAGEMVTPNRAVNNNFGGINVTINTSGGVNASAVADQIMREIKKRVAY